MWIVNADWIHCRFMLRFDKLMKSRVTAMANSSFSSSMQSYSEPITEEQEMAIYKSIKMNLQDIQRATHDINLKFKSIQGEMRVTAALVNAIESKAPAINQD